MASRSDGSAILTRRLAAAHKSWQPLDYMRRASLHLQSRYVAGLPLEPGGRKTSIALDAFISLRRQLKEPFLTMLVVAPKRPIFSTCPDELAKWTEFRDLILYPARPQKRRHA